MEVTVKNQDSTITFPLEHGYRDEDAIREANEGNHRIYCWTEGYWEARIDLDAKKVLAVMCRIGPIDCI